MSQFETATLPAGSGAREPVVVGADVYARRPPTLPRLGESRAGRWLASRLGDPCYRIRLDDVGAFIWKACDGETPLTAIRDRMREAFGARVEPADERLGRLCRRWCGRA